MNTTEELPDGVHFEVLTGRDKATGEQLRYGVLWADRPYDDCPRCGQRLAPAECPVMLDLGAGAGGALTERSQQHGCGEWLGVRWVELDDPDGDDAGIALAVQELVA